MVVMLLYGVHFCEEESLCLLILLVCVPPCKCVGQRQDQSSAGCYWRSWIYVESFHLDSSYKAYPVPWKAGPSKGACERCLHRVISLFQLYSWLRIIKREHVQRNKVMVSGGQKWCTKSSSSRRYVWSILYLGRSLETQGLRCLLGLLGSLWPGCAQFPASRRKAGVQHKPYLCTNDLGTGNHS